MAKKCFLFGHSDAPSSILPLLEERMEAHYNEYGVREFITGQYGHFDDLAATAGRHIKQRHPDVRLTLMTPYYPCPSDFELPENYDGTLYPEGMESVPRRIAIVRANAKMIEYADTTICYVHRPGNARTLLDYAKRCQRKGKIIVDSLLENLCGVQYNEYTQSHKKEVMFVEYLADIQRMEEHLNKAYGALLQFSDALNTLQDAQDSIRELDRYYGSEQWRQHLDALENGDLPEGTRCGVLSQDGIYNLLLKNRELAIEMLETATEILK